MHRMSLNHSLKLLKFTLSEFHNYFEILRSVAQGGHVALVGPELLILLPLPPKHQDQRHTLSRLPIMFLKLCFYILGFCVTHSLGVRKNSSTVGKGWKTISFVLINTKGRGSEEQTRILSSVPLNHRGIFLG